MRGLRKRKLALEVLTVLVAAVVVGSAGARPEATPGVTPTEIKLGGSVPLSGEASASGNVARGAEYYFKYVNDHGGVFGRKISYKYLDDAYDPGRAVQNTIRLVQQEQVFAMFNTLGTNNNLATRKYLNDNGVPQLFVATGATTFGRDYRQYPWTIGYMPPYSEEGRLYGNYILAHVKQPRVAVLYQDDGYHPRAEGTWRSVRSTVLIASPTPGRVRTAACGGTAHASTRAAGPASG